MAGTTALIRPYRQADHAAVYDVLELAKPGETTVIYLGRGL